MQAAPELEPVSVEQAAPLAAEAAPATEEHLQTAESISALECGSVVRRRAPHQISEELEAIVGCGLYLFTLSFEGQPAIIVIGSRR